jgi:SH3-like domain-containing protein
MKKSFNLYLSAVILLITIVSNKNIGQKESQDHIIRPLKDTVGSEQDTCQMGLVTLSTINLRKEPHHSAELVSQSILGTPLRILNNVDSWLQIQTPDNYTGWVDEASIKPVTKTEMEAWKKADKVIYLENTGWLYNSASEKSGVIGDIVGGGIIENIGGSGGYIMIKLPDGRIGFVEKRKVMDFDKWKRTGPGTADNVCSMSYTYLGLPYLWGGTSAKGVDCSGLVQSVFFRNGIILRRDASLQAAHGLPVDISDGFSRLKKGDLLFFGSKVNGNPHVTHVALYLGNNEYINSSGRVQINSLDPSKDDYNGLRINSLLMAKRVMGVENDPGIDYVKEHIWY